MSEKSTTPDLVEITRGLYAAANRRDVVAMLGYCAREAVLDGTDMGFGKFEGTGAIRAFIEDWWGSYEEYESLPDEIVQISDDLVLGLNNLVGRLPGTTEALRLRNAYVFRFRSAQIVHWKVYQDVDEARAAAECPAEERG